MTNDLVSFLRDRLDEDEQVARAAYAIDPAPWYEDVDYDDTYTNQRNHIDGTGLVYAADNVALWDREQSQTLSMTAATSVHVARHDPARVLAEVDAKRRIVDRIWKYAGPHMFTAGPDVLRLLALPYAHHPEYRPEWAPDA